MYKSDKIKTVNDKRKIIIRQKVKIFLFSLMCCRSGDSNSSDDVPCTLLGVNLYKSWASNGEGAHLTVCVDLYFEI